MKSLSLSALPAFLLTPFTSAVAHPEVESKLPEEGLILPSSSLSDLIAPGQFVGGSSRSLGRSTSLTEQEKCSQTLGYQYNATELAQYDPFLALENFNTMGCDYIFGDDERFPGANFTNCDRYDEEIQDAVENLCEYQVENVDFIIWDTRTNDENQEKVPSLIYANQPLCFPPTCDYATIFFLVNVNFLGYFAQDGGLVEMRYSGTSGMECAQSLTRNYGNELFLTADGKLRTDPLEETSLTPYNPDTIFTENCEEQKDPTKKFCYQKGMFEDVRPLCEEIGGTYVEYDIKQLTTDYTYETRKSVSKNVPFCASQKCIPKEAMAYTAFFFQQLFYEQYEFQSSICLENKYSKFEYMDEAALIATGSCSQLRGDKFTAEQKEELCSKHDDICPASCGKCEEYPNNKFVQKLWEGKATTFKTCDWLSKQSDARIANICARNGFKKAFGPAYSACPYTCGANENEDLELSDSFMEWSRRLI